MKQIKGDTLFCISNTIIGKVTFSPIKKSMRKDYIFVGDVATSEDGYSGYIISKNNHHKKEVLVLCNPSDFETLADGDIISIEPDGRVNVLIEKNSIHNALLVTEKCNCACIMCPQPSISKEEDKFPSILKIISLIDRNSKVLGITGGEPTLLEDKLIELVSLCKKMLPQTELLLLSNGIKFDDFDFVKKLVSVRHPSLTIDIPLHADTDTEHDAICRVKGFNRTIKGLYHLALFKQKIGIRIVIHKMNYKRLPQLSEFIYRNFPFVFHVAFIQLEPMGLVRDNLEKVYIDPYDYNEQLEKAVKNLWLRGMNVSIYNAQSCVIPKSLWKYSRKSISSWKNIYLEECNHCKQNNECGGLFESSIDLHSKHIKAL